MIVYGFEMKAAAGIKGVCRLIIVNCSDIPPVELIYNHILGLEGKWRVPVNLIVLFYRQ